MNPISLLPLCGLVTLIGEACIQWMYVSIRPGSSIFGLSIHRATKLNPQLRKNISDDTTLCMGLVMSQEWSGSNKAIETFSYDF